MRLILHGWRFGLTGSERCNQSQPGNLLADILARVISVTRPFGAVAPVDVTTSNVQHYVGLMNVAGGQVTLAVGIQWHNRTVFFKAHRHVKMARLVVKAAEGRTNV